MIDAKDARRLQAILAEIRRRESVRYDFTDYSFKTQAAVLADKSRAQAWQCTRRAGKSTAWAKKALNRIVNDSNSKGLFLALTLDSAKGILWDIVEQELESKKISSKAYKQEGRFEFENGSSLRFFGVDATYREMKRILGQKYTTIGIDECGSMTVDVKHLVLQMIWPALSDVQGDLTLLGTPENIPRTFFQEVTEGKEKSLSWSIHKWTAYDNPYMKENWTKTINELLSNDPNVATTSWFKTHYLNQWCADDGLLIVHITAHNYANELPNRKWFYVLGVDLGFNDASAFAVLAYHPDEREIFVVHASKASGMDFTDVANQIKVLKQKYPIYKIIVDGANKQGVQEIQRRHQIPMESAEKIGKATYLRMLSDDVKQGIIKLVRDETRQLVEEWAELQWLKDTDEEDPRCENHLSDATIYAWRHALNNRNPQLERKEWTPDEQIKKQMEEEGRKMLEQMREERFLY
jgi:phage terminase large subunit